MKSIIAIAEDDPVTRKQYHQRFAFYEEIEIAAVAGNGKDLLDKLSKLTQEQFPSVILLDIEMPELSGIETASVISEYYPSVDIIMLTVFKDEEKIFQSVKAGASGYLLKDSSTSQIIEAINEVKSGGVPLSRSIARKVLQYMRQLSTEGMEAKSRKENRFDLSEREIEILTAIVNDKTEVEIAESFYLSRHTVRSHVKNIYKKLQVHSRGAVVKAAYQYNLISDKSKLNPL
jgi:DNA-binding NarL/FixJ family response regulator